MHALLVSLLKLKSQHVGTEFVKINLLLTNNVFSFSRERPSQWLQA
jgi:hypothetical protein